MKIHDSIAQVLKSKNINKVLSIKPDDTVYDALTLMAEHDVGALLVLADGELAGILSERDYARKGILLGHPSRETPVSQMMTSPVVFVGPEHTVDECLETMTRHRFRHLPVVDRSGVIGVVSIGDLVKWVISRQDRAIQELEGYVTGAYPA
jgi:CBS domain-containing protein